MTDDPIKIRPTRSESRGEFPQHTEAGAETEHRQLSALDARDLAARRLAEHVSGGRSGYDRRDVTDE